jgi:hypothetical protein
MRGSKRITLLAVGLWLMSCIVGSLFPWEVVYRARMGLDEIYDVFAVADQIKGQRRVLLVGSSPIVIGMSARQIEQRTGLPTFNVGINDAAEFFDDYMSRILPHVRKGDIVVVSDPRWLDPSRAKLAPGCTEKVAGNCLGWWFNALPHLSLVSRFLFDFHHVIGAKVIDRDAHGDNDAMDPTRLHKAVDTMPPLNKMIAALDIKQMAQIIDEFHRHEACPLLAVGPVYVNEREKALWNSQVTSLQSAVSKSGYGRFLLADDVLQTDRANFLDSYEHPSPLERDSWTNRIIDRLTDRSMGPCVTFTAAQ